jgi:ornithine cyclodeaminase/alanine dehydrogenase-like protein (mu-crystallin family)
VKAALIGAGQIARQHLACLKTLPGVDLAAICDLSPATAEAAAERYGIRSWFTDHRAMLEKVRPDVVHVTTPPTSHFGLAMDSVNAGAHVKNWRRWSGAPGMPAAISSRTIITFSTMPLRGFCGASSPANSGR